jgi:hypothetical protein
MRCALIGMGGYSVNSLYITLPSFAFCNFSNKALFTKISSTFIFLLIDFLLPTICYQRDL